MGSPRSASATSTAAKQAANIGTRSEVAVVISTVKAMPVNGARTTAAKKAAIPTTAKA